MDMMTMMLKGMGIDPEGIVAQATKMGAVFEQMARTQADMLAKLLEIQHAQNAMMSAMGLYVPPPEGDVAKLIADETNRHLQAHGGPIPDGNPRLIELAS